METQILLRKEVSFQNTAWAPIKNNFSIYEVLNDIRNEKYKKFISDLRNLLFVGKRESYDINKKQLPAVTFCGTFTNKRAKSNIDAYNELIVIDIDNLNKEQIISIKNILLNDEFVFTFWISPSGEGIKGLIKLRFDYILDINIIDNCHKAAFNKLKEYFQLKYNILIDESGKDTTRLCFLSSDPELVLKNQCNEFTISQSEILENISFSNISSIAYKLTNFNQSAKAYNKNLSYNRKLMQSIIRYLRKNRFSITKDYEDWYRVSYALSNTFTFEIGEKYFIELSKLDTNKYNEDDCKYMFRYCYDNTLGAITFNTLKYLAKQKGYKFKEEEVLKND